MDETNGGWAVDQGEVDSRCWAPVPDDPLLVDLYDEPDQPEWQERALCAQTDPEAFFPEKGGSTREAKRICSGCEVRAECLEYALMHDERFGIWGGLSERERRRLKRRAV
jgi:WhiB family redox-sensing transcriptional regulator